MSVYSGFTTRQTEESYYQHLYNMVYLLQLRVLRLYEKGKTRLLDDGRVVRRQTLLQVLHAPV